MRVATAILIWFAVSYGKESNSQITQPAPVAEIDDGQWGWMVVVLTALLVFIPLPCWAMLSR